jgi:hypothetical protein
MKKFIPLLLFVILIGLTSCYKTSSEPSIIYTVKYEVETSGDVAIDTIQYKDMSGATVTKVNVISKFQHYFTSENAYDASLYVAGNLVNGTVSANLSILKGTTIMYEDPFSEIWEGEDEPLPFTYNSSRKLAISK